MLKKIKQMAISTLFCITTLFLTGCADIQIFEEPEITHAVEVSDREMRMGAFYVKNGTKFAEVYKPLGNCTNAAKKMQSNRVFYMLEDQDMIPVHYKNEIIAYSSVSADLKRVTLERFKDMGHSLGIYGGTIEDDGLYHFNIEKNVAVGSDAERIFENVVSEEIRLKSIGGLDIANFIDKETGIIIKLKANEKYLVEFYAGTYFYRTAFTADTQFLKAFELYTYDNEYIEDTINGYMSFNTPNYLKSGYYNINGTGLFLYHAYERGQQVENETYNEGYYENREELVATYSKQYNISVPRETKDLKINIKYSAATDAYDKNVDVSAYVVSPDGSGYDMDVNTKGKEMSLSLKTAMAGDWTIHISPKSLVIDEMNVESDTMYEDTFCEEKVFEVEEDTPFQMFYADVSGDGKVYGSIIGPGGITYNLEEMVYKEKNKSRRYMVYKLPYAKAGTYTVKIYHYKSQTAISNLQMIPYDDNDSEIIIIEE